MYDLKPAVSTFLFFHLSSNLSCLLRRKDPNLWVQALSFFSSRRECKGQIPEVLQHIDEDQLMPPLMVIQTLADSQFSTLSDIKVSNCTIETLANLHKTSLRMCSVSMHGVLKLQ